MSEPATSASLTISTSKGPISIELWAKEVPETSKQFLQNCVDKKYHGKSFGTITGDLVQITSDDVRYTLRNEFHTRIKFKKGSLAAVRENEDAAHNHSVDEFFVTLHEVPYHNCYIVFGKVVGESIYNVVKIGDSDMGESGPLYPAVITDVVVHSCPFELVPSVSEPVEAEEPPKKKPKKKAQVQLNYDEDEDEEDETRGFQMKSAHELLNDKKLSKDAVERVPDASSRAVEAESAETSDEFAKDEGVARGNNDDHQDAEDPSTHATVSSPDDETDSWPKTKKKKKPSRDPLLDSDYDSNLDLSGDEFDPATFQSHRFGR